MIHRIRCQILFVALALLLAACFARRSNAAPDEGDQTGPPNVLFLICDDLNCDLGCYGHPQVQSPNIDALAARGLRFEHAYCQYPLCGPSRASFMTGMYPDQTLVHRNAIYIREHLPNVQTMSQLFRRNGYFATRIGKLYHYNVPLHIGTSGHDDPYSWDATINPYGRDRIDEDSVFTLTPGRYGGTLSWLAADGTDEEQTDGISATEATRLLEKYGRDKTRFFLAVGLFRPHTPYVAPRKYFDLYPREEIVVPQVPSGYLETLPVPARKSINRKKEQINLADHLARQAIQAYYASITFADAQVGRILDSLRANGLDKNTIVVFTSDHGYHMGEHGHYQKTTLFENAARVPLIISVPGSQAAGWTTGTPAEMVDFYPTLADLCKLAKPKNLSGVSLVPLLRDATAQPRTSAFTQYANGYSIRTARYRYTEWGKDGAEGAELYDHQDDPEEMTNLAHPAHLAQHPDRVELIDGLSRQLRARIAHANRPPPGITQIKFENRRRVSN